MDAPRASEENTRDLNGRRPPSPLPPTREVSHASASAAQASAQRSEQSVQCESASPSAADSSAPTHRATAAAIEIGTTAASRAAMSAGKSPPPTATGAPALAIEAAAAGTSAPATVTQPISTNTTTTATSATTAHPWQSDENFEPISLPTPRERGQADWEEACAIVAGDRKCKFDPRPASTTVAEDLAALRREMQEAYVQERGFHTLREAEKEQSKRQTEEQRLKWCAEQLKALDIYRATREAEADYRFQLIRDGQLQDERTADYQRQIEQRRRALSQRREQEAWEQNEREEERRYDEERARLLAERDQRLAELNSFARNYWANHQEYDAERARDTAASIASELESLRRDDEERAHRARSRHRQQPSTHNNNNNRERQRQVRQGAVSRRPASPRRRHPSQDTRERHSRAQSPSNTDRLENNQTIRETRSNVQRRSPSLASRTLATADEGRDATNDVPRETNHVEDHALLTGEWAPRSLRQYERLRYLQGRAFDERTIKPKRLQAWIDHMLINGHWQPRCERQRARIAELQLHPSPEEDRDE